jgi:hypothetical protein
MKPTREFLGNPEMPFQAIVFMPGAKNLAIGYFLENQQSIELKNAFWKKMPTPE